VLGRGTIDALNVAPAQRVRQLERLRWLPNFGPGPLIMVNPPAYRLWALHDGGSAAPLDMRVVVGTALKIEISLFVGQMRYVEFNPYWNIPRSMLDKETLPKLKRNPAYLTRNGMEKVPSGASAAAPGRQGARAPAPGAEERTGTD